MSGRDREVGTRHETAPSTRWRRAGAGVLPTSRPSDCGLSPTERVVATIDGRELERVQTLSVVLDDYPLQQILGRPLVKDKWLLWNPVSKAALKHWPGLASRVMHGLAHSVVERTIEGAIAMGFDAVWGYYESAFILVDATTILEAFGAYHDVIEDGHGNLTYMYKGPAIPTPAAYESWPHFPDADEIAHDVYTVFTRLRREYGERICICGETPTDLYDGIQLAMGLAGIARHVRTDPAFVRRWVARLEEVAVKTSMAMLDAGLTMILKSDDMAYKTGPQMDPRIIDEIFGPSYERLCMAVHQRGGRILLHACGDNTRLFDLFIKWGFDGGHALETTSNVDIAYEKTTHGGRFTIVGGMGVDYLLTARSLPTEVVAATREVVRVCAPGGRFLLAPAHSHSDIDMTKVRLMLDTAWQSDWPRTAHGERT